jgi:hypothetical protein
MAGAGAKLFTSGSVLTADQVNTFLMDQSIMRFASTTARDAAFGGAGEPTLSEGMFAYTTDTNTLWSYNGSSWVAVLGSDIGAISTSNRNVLINGDFKVWQRGTSKAMGTGTGTGFLADRWIANRSGYAAGGTVSRQTATLDGFQYCSRVQRDSATSGTAIVYYFQTMESSNCVPLINKTVSYSFYIRAGANLSGSVVARLYSGTATDQGNYPDSAITGSVTVITSTLSLTTSWQRVTLSGTVGATAAQLFAGFEWTPSGTAGAADYFEVTGVQLEAGSVATPFEFENYGTTLGKCQRYYQQSYIAGTPAGTNTTTNLTRISCSYISIYGNGSVFFSTQLRAQPTIALWLAGGTASQWAWDQTGVGAENVATGANGVTTIGFSPATAALTAARVVASGHWTASAEL